MLVYALKYLDTSFPQGVFSSLELAAQHFASFAESETLTFDELTHDLAYTHYIWPHLPPVHQPVELVAYVLDGTSSYDDQRKRLFYELVQRFRSGS